MILAVPRTCRPMRGGCRPPQGWAESSLHAPPGMLHLVGTRYIDSFRQPARRPHVLFPRTTQAQLMSRPLVEMADIVRCAGQSFLEHSCRWINWQHRKVLLAIARCCTAALGGHRDRCTGCGHTSRISYNSCRNRHCPRCQGNARRRWLQAREPWPTTPPCSPSTPPS